MVICLDSGSVNYENLGVTTSLRGVMNFKLKFSVSSVGVHSGKFGGLFPDSFWVAWNFLENFEDSKTGTVFQDFYVNIPADKYI